MKVAVIGSGYVGLVSGACFAGIGHDVVCVDNDPRKIALLESGGVPIYEPGLDDLIADNVAAGRLRFTTDLAAAVSDADVVFIAVGTPTNESDGSADLRYVYAVTREIAPALSGFTVLVTKSTVPVGAGDEVEQIIRAVNPDADVSIVSNPEFLREGVAIPDFQKPDRIVVGSNDERGGALMRQLYAPIIDAGYPFFLMDRRGAELTKYAANALLATKIAFINEIADLCEKVGTNVRDVSKGVGLDKRIGAMFLEAGPGYGGSCFPKDTLALLRIGEAFGASQSIVSAVVESNDRRKVDMGRKVVDALGSPEGKVVAILGLAFKANTDDVRESPAISIIQTLRENGITVRLSDPQGLKSAPELFPDVSLHEDHYEAIAGADGVVVVTEWQQFRDLDLARVKSLMRGTLFADLRNLIAEADLDAAGLDHIGVGRPAKLTEAKDRTATQPLGAAASHLHVVPSDMKTILITGGAGFLGSHLAARLIEEGHNVYCLDNLHTGRRANLASLVESNRITLVEHDVIQPLPTMPCFDEIYNLACPASPIHYQADPVATLRVCSDGVLNVLRRAAEDGANIFHTSTSEVYGDPEIHPQHERYHGNVNPVGPRSCYDEGKRFAETLLTDFCQQNDLRLRMVRIFNTYGPRMLPDDGRVVSNFIVQALQGDPITIYGDGSQTRSFCYADDMIDGFLGLMRAGEGAEGPMNIGNPNEITVGELAHIVVQMTGSKSEIIHMPLPIDDPRRRRPDISRAQSVLGWSPKVELSRGLEATIAYFRGEIARGAPLKTIAFATA